MKFTAKKRHRLEKSGCRFLRGYDRFYNINITCRKKCVNIHSERYWNSVSIIAIIITVLCIGFTYQYMICIPFIIRKEG